MLQQPLCGSSLRRKAAQSVFALFIAFFFFTALLFTGCKEDTDDDPKFELNSNLIGKWTSTSSDSYTITDTKLTYTDWQGEISYAGTIRHATAFSNTAGVIIFEYDNDRKPKYYASYDPDTFEPIGNPLQLKGNFIGVYYKDLSSGVSVKMGTAYIDGGAEEPTLDAAKSAFTLGKEGDYMSYYGTYTK